MLDYVYYLSMLLILNQAWSFAFSFQVLKITMTWVFSVSCHHIWNWVALEKTLFCKPWRNYMLGYHLSCLCKQNWTLFYLCCSTVEEQIVVLPRESCHLRLVLNECFPMCPQQWIWLWLNHLFERKYFDIFFKQVAKQYVKIACSDWLTELVLVCFSRWWIEAHGGGVGVLGGFCLLFFFFFLRGLWTHFSALSRSLNSCTGSTMELFCNTVDRLIALVSLPFTILFNIFLFWASLLSVLFRCHCVVKRYFHKTMSHPALVVINHICFQKVFSKAPPQQAA